MALKLNLKKSIFPVEIGAFTFEVDLSDDKVKDFEAKMASFLEGVEAAAADEATFTELLGNVYDELLGDGAYKKLYDHTKRVDILAELLGDLMLALVSKLPGRTTLIDALKASDTTLKSKQPDGN
ncbi:MAG: hypothetical protein FWE07_02195 [Turicibacter sp.]|nr:hypothetical protein [Turicibacter sp.]